MFERLTINNFQTHELLEIDFDENITSIIGDSDVGKSSILRALWWVLSNKPSGTSFIRHGAKEAVVELVVDGHVIRRTRGKKTNTYTLDGEEFAAMGNEVPSDILKVIGTAAVNFQGQHDAPFWFSESAGAVSRELNDMTGIGVMDRALSNVASKLRSASADLQHLEDAVQELQTEVESFDYLPDADDALTELERLHERLLETERDTQQLSAIIAQLDTEQKIIDEQQTFIEDAGFLLNAMTDKQRLERDVQQLSAIIAQLDAKQKIVRVQQAFITDTEPLLALLEKRDSAKIIVSSLEKHTANLQRLSVIVDAPFPSADELSTLLTTAERLRHISSEINKLRAAMREIGELKCRQQEKEKECALLKQKLLKNIGETCPLCGNQISSSHFS